MRGIGGGLRVRDSCASGYRYEDKRRFNGIFAPTSVIKELCILFQAHKCVSAFSFRFFPRRARIPTPLSLSLHSLTRWLGSTDENKYTQHRNSFEKLETTRVNYFAWRIRRTSSGRCFLIDSRRPEGRAI